MNTKEVHMDDKKRIEELEAKVQEAKRLLKLVTPTSTAQELAIANFIKS